MVLDWLPILASGFAGSLTGVITTVLVYSFQRRDDKLAMKREVGARLSAAYMNYHAHILSSETAQRVVRQLFYHDFSAEEVEKVVFMYMFLNAVYLEWNFTKQFEHSKEAFRRTVTGMFGRFARAPALETRFLLERFDELFSDFPTEFRDEILQYSAQGSCKTN